MGNCVSNQSKDADKNQAKPDPLEEGELPKEYDPEKYAEILETALKEGNNDLAIKCLQECDVERREEVSDAFMTKTEKNLLDECKNHLSGTGAFTAELLLRPKAAVVAKVLKDCLDNIGESEKRLIEVICGSKDLTEIQTLYEEQFGKTLNEDIKSSECMEDVKDILAAFTEADKEFDEGSCEEWANKLVEAAGSNNLFEGDKVFQSCMTSKSKTDIQEILEGFLKNCQRDMTVEIEKQFAEGRERVNYTTLAKMMRNPWLYLADKVHELLPSEKQEEQMQLLFILLSQDEDGLANLKTTYQSAHLENVSRDVRDETQDNFLQRVLLKAVK